MPPPPPPLPPPSSPRRTFVSYAAPYSGGRRHRRAAVAGAVLLALLGGGSVLLTTDGKALEKGAEEAFQRASSDLQQWIAVDAPLVPAALKAELGTWRPSDPLAQSGGGGSDGRGGGGVCASVTRTFLTVGMRVPKSASSTLQDLVDALAPANRFATSEVVQRHGVPGGFNRTAEEARLAAYLSSLRRRTVWTSHVPFLDFAALGLPRPVYFATIRDPIKRMVSHYNYEHFSSERPAYMQLLHQDARAEPFPRCVQGHMDAEASGGGGRSRSRSRKRRTTTTTTTRLLKGSGGGGRSSGRAAGVFDCVQTAGLQVRFFCGVVEECRRPSRDTLARALAHVNEQFAAVVVVEEMLLSFRVLEALLPRLFRGLVDRYVAGGGGGDGVVRGSGGGSGSGSSSGGGAAGETRSRVNTAHKALVGGAGALTAAQRRFLEGLEGIRLEYTLYNHTRRRLHAQAEGCGIAVPTARHDAP